MTDQPYTDADLRAEAASQHADLASDSDYMGVGEAMESSWVPSTETAEDGSARTWKNLLVTLDETGDDEDYAAYDDAQRQIYDLINGAADISQWAVDLGADGLEPEEHSLTINGDDRPIARIHFAFEPDMPDEMRAALVEGIGQAIADHL
ncbi:hypothetical protein ACFU98_10760 [Streptomyces sp. NPDC057575]|uniref:hypothetical protein n=1 Tax=unclassified Streptomyces TaxID=2593676 RepID=UPI0036A776C9